MTRILLLGAVTLLGGAVAWLYSGHIVVLPGSPTPEYVFLLPGGRALLVAIVIAGCVIVPAAVLLRSATPFWPLLLLAFPVATVLLLATSARTYAPAWLFLFFDWRWGFLLLVGALVVRELGTLTRTTRGADSGPTHTFGRLRSVEIAVLLVLTILTLVASPKERFEGRTDGDEPKYLRFDENWYRGRGLNVADLSDIKELPPGSTPAVLRNVPRLVSAGGMIVRDLAADVCHTLGRCAPPPRATEGGNLFVVGKRGGLYQIHNPGGPLLLLPAYYIDRLLNTTNDYHPHFPTHLYATNIALIVLYLAWSLVLYRWLARHTGDSIVPALVTVMLMTSLPVVAFSYQYYPEVAAGLLVTIVTSYLAMSTDTRSPVAFLFGVVAGYIPWLHLRFGSVPIAAAVVFFATRRGHARAIVAFACGIAVPLVALGFYNYHIVGSMMPWVMWNLQADSPGFNVSRMTNDLPRFWTDRGAGLLAHAPVYLLALPGFLLLWRKRHDLVLMLAAIALPVAAMSAAHSFSAGWTTPGRYIAALAPLLALPMSETLTRYRRSPRFVAFALLLALVSISNGLLYNVNFVRGQNDLHNPTVSGWATPLLFTPATVAGIDVVQALWWLLTLGLFALPIVQRRRVSALPHRARKQTMAMAVALSCFAVAGSAVGAWSGRTFERKNQRGRDTRIEALTAHLSRADGIVWSGARGQTTAARLWPIGPEPVLAIGDLEAIAGAPFDLKLELHAGNGELTWGLATVRFGDGNTTTRAAIVESASIPHVFQRAGRYPLLVHVDIGDSQSLERSVVVNVRE